MTFPLVDRVRRRSFGQVARIAAAWPAALVLLAALTYAGLWLLGLAVLLLSHAASFDMHVRVESWGEVAAVLVLPPMVLLLLWSVLRSTKRAT